MKVIHYEINLTYNKCRIKDKFSDSITCQFNLLQEANTKNELKVK